ncbi:MAG: AraC family transcriptional regulator, partial [Chloroflexi bacterium]|nr:AraC family transcriptional regulator [Chloroflexota bacterium]
SLRAGDLFIVPPNYPFVYQAAQVNQYHWFAMAGKWPSLLGEIPRILKFSPGYDAELEANFVEIREMLIVKRLGYPLKAVSRFYNLLARLEGLQQSKLPTPSSYPEAVRNAIIFLQENWSEPFSARETAVHVHLSQSHLRALFEKWVGESPKRYHTRCRIERAMRLFRNQRLPVQVVAAHVGFHDVGYFSRVFKQIAGVPPSQYAKVPREM